MQCLHFRRQFGHTGSPHTVHFRTCAVCTRCSQELHTVVQPKQTSFLHRAQSRRCVAQAAWPQCAQFLRQSLHVSFLHTEHAPPCDFRRHIVLPHTEHLKEHPLHTHSPQRAQRSACFWQTVFPHREQTRRQSLHVREPQMAQTFASLGATRFLQVPHSTMQDRHTGSPERSDFRRCVAQTKPPQLLHARSSFL